VQSATGPGIDEPLSELLARGARRESEARARLLAADFAAIRDRALAFADAEVDAAGREPSRIPLLAELLPCALGAGDDDVAARVLRALERAAAAVGPAVSPVAAAALARARTALAEEARASAPGRLATARSDAPDGGCEEPASARAARVSTLGHALLADRAAGFAADPAREERFLEGVASLLVDQDEDGGWNEGAGEGDATARVLDDAIAIALLEGASDSRGSLLAAAAARALAFLAATQSAAGDWRRDLPATIANLRAAMLVLPLVEARHPAVVDAAAFPVAARGGRFVERGFAWCLSRKPDLGWDGAGEVQGAPDGALALAVAGSALVREYGAFRARDPLATARARGLA